jgi:hypothetical protein
LKDYPKVARASAAVLDNVKAKFAALLDKA